MGDSYGSMTKPWQEPQRQTNSIVMPKDTHVMGHRNVRSLFRGGATAQVAREIEGHKLDILGINECRLNKPGGEKEDMVLDWTWPEERSEQWLCYCPLMEARGEEKQTQTQNNLVSHCGEGKRQTDRDETHGQEQDRQQTTTSSGGKMSGPCAP